MRIIVGLGNPESGYKGTRHNIGFEAVNKLGYDHNIEIKKRKHRAEIGKGTIKGEEVMLVKPQTYMNLSGESVREILKFYKIGIESVIVIYDDITLPLGKIKIRERGSAGGHNGIRNMIYETGTDEFDRIKIGIGEKPKEYVLSDYVLSRFVESEGKDMIEGVTRATEAIEAIIEEGIESAMNKFNKKNR